MARDINVALIGQKFMGRAHSNALGQVGKFFDLGADVVKHTICGRNEAELDAFAQKWGWNHTTTNWKSIAKSDDIDLVDIATPNLLHSGPAIAALEAGKHVACEKPLANTLVEARKMVDAAKKAKKQKTFVWYNYRRCPAAAFAHKLVKEKRIGKIFHVRAVYLQDWGLGDTPRSWRFQKSQAGSGAHGDLNAHIVDMARFLTGDEIVEVHGAVARTFFPMRPSTDNPRKKAKSDVDDALAFTASMKGGAVCSFEASRVAAPHQNGHSIEINGEKGSLRFDFEDMNLLHFHDAANGSREGGWRRIMCTSAGNHPYADAWWPDAHLIGYEHAFTNMMADIVRSLTGKKPEVPLPTFADAYETQRVLEAALLAAKTRRAVKLSEVR